MQSRSKTRTSSALEGSLWRRGSPPTVYGPWPYVYHNARLDDFIGKTKRDDGSTPPSDLRIFKEDIVPLAVDYIAKSASDGIVYDKGISLPCATQGVGLNWVSASEWAAIEPTDEELVSSLLANTNPFRYSVSVPVMVTELIEAATLFKIALNNLFVIIGSQHLNYVFGWEQMMRDIRTLTGITREIERRIAEFNSLVSKGGLRRRVKLHTKAAQKLAGPYQAWSTHGLSFTANTTTTYKTSIWGSVRWKPARPTGIDISKLTSFNEAAKIVLDLGAIDASTIWEAIPFSWLVDYFLNVGDTLQALENTDTVVPYDICIMRKRETWSSNVLIQQTNTSWPWTREYASRGGTVYQSFKLRTVKTVSGLSDLLSFGIMSDRQALNLLALLLSLARFR